jgi:hypothetical protein
VPIPQYKRHSPHHALHKTSHPGLSVTPKVEKRSTKAEFCSSTADLCSLVTIKGTYQWLCAEKP